MPSSEIRKYDNRDIIERLEATEKVIENIPDLTLYADFITKYNEIKQITDKFVRKDVDTTIEALYNFTKSPKVPTPVDTSDVATKGYVDSNIDSFVKNNEEEVIYKSWTFAKPISGQNAERGDQLVTLSQLNAMHPELGSKLDINILTPQEVKGPVKFLNDVILKDYLNKTTTNEQTVKGNIIFENPVLGVSSDNNNSFVIKSQLTNLLQSYLNKEDQGEQTIAGNIKFTQKVTLPSGTEFENAKFSGSSLTFNNSDVLTQSSLKLYEWEKLPIFKGTDSTPTNKQPVIKEYLDKVIEEKQFISDDIPKLTADNNFSGTNKFHAIKIGDKFLDNLYLRVDNPNPQEVKGIINFADGLTIKGEPFQQMSTSSFTVAMWIVGALLVGGGVTSLVSNKIRFFGSTVLDRLTGYQTMYPINATQIHIGNDIISLDDINNGHLNSALLRAPIGKNAYFYHIPILNVAHKDIYRYHIITDVGTVTWRDNHTLIDGYDVAGFSSHYFFYDENAKEIKEVCADLLRTTILKETENETLQYNIHVNCVPSTSQTGYKFNKFGYVMGYLESSVFDRVPVKELPKYVVYKAAFQAVSQPQNYYRTFEDAYKSPYAMFNDYLISIGSRYYLPKNDNTDKDRQSFVVLSADNVNRGGDEYHTFNNEIYTLRGNYSLGASVFHPADSTDYSHTTDRFGGNAQKFNFIAEHDCKDTDKNVSTLTATQNDNTIKYSHSSLREHVWKELTFENIFKENKLEHNDKNTPKCTTSLLTTNINYIYPQQADQIKTCSAEFISNVKRYCDLSSQKPRFDVEHTVKLGHIEPLEKNMYPSIISFDLLNGNVKTVEGKMGTSIYLGDYVNFIEKESEEKKHFIWAKWTGVPQLKKDSAANDESSGLSFWADSFFDNNEEHEIIGFKTFDKLFEHVEYGTKLEYTSHDRKISYGLCPDPCNSNKPLIAAYTYNSTTCPIDDTSEVSIKDKLRIRDTVTIKQPTSELTKLQDGEVVTKPIVEALDEDIKKLEQTEDTFYKVFNSSLTPEQKENLPNTLNIDNIAWWVFKSGVHAITGYLQSKDREYVAKDGKTYPANVRVFTDEKNNPIAEFVPIGDDTNPNPRHGISAGQVFFDKALNNPIGAIKDLWGRFSKKKRTDLNNKDEIIGDVWIEASQEHHLPPNTSFSINGTGDTNDTSFFKIDRTVTRDKNNNLVESQISDFNTLVFGRNPKQDEDSEELNTLFATHRYAKKLGFDAVSESGLKYSYSHIVTSPEPSSQLKTVIDTPTAEAATIRYITKREEGKNIESKLKIKKDRLTFTGIDKVEKEIAFVGTATTLELKNKDKDCLTIKPPIREENTTISEIRLDKESNLMENYLNLTELHASLKLHCGSKENLLTISDPNSKKDLKIITEKEYKILNDRIVELEKQVEILTKILVKRK